MKPRCETEANCAPAKKSFDKSMMQQLKSVKWLVNALVEQFKLNVRNDVYSHGAIARKEVSEGAQLLQHVFSGAVE